MTDLSEYDIIAEELVAMIRASGAVPAVLVTLDQVEERLKCEQSLAEFVRHAWHVVEPTTELVWNWHLDVLCGYLEAVWDGRVKKLVVNIPPGTMKSLIIMVFFPAWGWTKKPGYRYLCGTNDGTLATRDALRMRQVVSSEWYQGHWSDKVRLSNEQADKGLFANASRGHRESQGILAKVTGKRGDMLLIDDPHDTKQVESEVQRDAVIEAFDMAWSSRRNDLENSPIIIVMQRVHHADLTARVMTKRGWVCLAIPMRYDPDITYDPSNDIGRPDLADPRVEPGELMFPRKFPESAVKDLEADLGTYGTAGQLQQSPTPKGGGILKPSLMRVWPNNKPLPPLQYILQSYDTAFTKDTANDPTACSVWGIFFFEGRNNAMLIDCWQDYMEYPELRTRVIRDWGSRYCGDKKDPANKPRQADLCLIEKKGSGQSLLQDLRTTQVRFVEYNPGLADKVARAHLITPLLDGGVIWVPESKGGEVWATWATWLQKQMERFPNDDHDDGVDTVTQALRYLRDAGFLTLRQSNRDEGKESPTLQPVINPYDQ